MRGITDTMREAEKVFQKAESGEVWNREVEELKDFDTHYAEEEKNNKSVDNENDVRDNEGEDRGNEPVRITNRITRYPDGHIDVKLKYRQKKGESRAVRIARRKAELREIVRDANGEAGERGVFVNALSDNSKAIIDNRIANGETREAIAQNCKVQFNKYLSNYSEKTSEAKEKKIIATLLTLRGAEYYAEGNFDTGRNNGNPDGQGNARRNAQEMGPRGRGQNADKNASISRSNKGGFSSGKNASISMDPTRKAPNGKPSNLTPEQWKQVRTPAFKKWFGDWEHGKGNPALLDENGEPKVFYHGTNADFNAFDKSMQGKFDAVKIAWVNGKPTKLKDNLFFFTSDKALAQRHADGAVELSGEGNAKVIPCFISAKNALVEDMDKWYATKKLYDTQLYYDRNTEDFQKKMKDGNHDVLILRNPIDESDTLVGVVNPNQIKSATDNVGTFSKDTDDIRYSISEADEAVASKAEEATSSWFDKLTNKFAKKMSLNADKIKTAARKEEPSIGLYDSIFGSPGRIAKRVAAFKPFFQMADKAMHKLTKLRSDYLKDLGKAMDIVKTDAERQDLTSILWMGDAEGKEYTDGELRENGATDNVIKAYRRVRSLIRRVGDALDDAKRRPQWKTENNVSDAHIEELRNDKFVNPKSIKVSTNADGKKVVSYKEYANHERTYEGITEEALAQMYADDAIEVLSATKRADDLYDVDVREGFGGLNRLGGYIPHFFHEYMIRLQTPDGKRTVIGSGRTEAEAVKIAEEWLKNNTIPDNAEIFIAPKSANFETLGMKEDAYAPIMGDKDFWKMQKLLAKNNDLTLAEAKEIVNGSIKQKNRHRFYGNFMHRTGAEGFEQNMQWVLRHYVNSAARYIAMETEFNYNAFNQSLP